jgi:parallel beta-helix repeat protein
MKGFTIRNADFSGVQLIGVTNFRLWDGVYLDNGEYGPFPICSTHGEIGENFASGHEDASIYVGDDDGILVHDNTVSDNVIGIEVENSTNVVVRGNSIVGNTAGILVVVLPDLPFYYTDSVLIEDNVITSNNFPNPIPPDSGDVIGLIPTGSGIVNVGGDRVVVRRNIITGNDSLGIGTIANSFFVEDPRIEPFVDLNRTAGNTITGNGAHPDPLRAFTPGADIIFIPHVIDLFTGDLIALDPDPSDNCYADNEFGVDFPAGVTAEFACD